MSDVKLEEVGRRLYVTLPFGHPAKDRLKAMGAHWCDQGSKRWWIAKGKLPQVEALLKEVEGRPPPEEDPDKVTLVGKAKYKGQTYYVRAVGFSEEKGNRCLLTTLDGKRKFWAGLANPCGGGHDGSGDVAVMLKEYPAVEIRGRKEKMTLGKIRRFIERQKDPRTRRGECTECGEYGPAGETCEECHEGTHV